VPHPREARGAGTNRVAVGRGLAGTRSRRGRRLVALALERFDHFSEATRAALKARGEATLEANPEIVESRAAVAEAYGAKSGNDEGVR